MNPQDTFIDLLLAAMKDAALELKLTQLAVQFDPTETGKGAFERVRIIVIPEKLEYTWPGHAPAGSMGRG